MAILGSRFGFNTDRAMAVRTAQNLIVVVSEKQHEIERNAAEARARLKDRHVTSLLADDYADAGD